MKSCQEEIRINFEKEIPEEADVRILKRITEEIVKTEKLNVEEYSGMIPFEIMIMLLVYGYMNGVFSSRKIEQRCRRDVYFMYLLNGYDAPDHTTIARFRKKQKKLISEFFLCVLKYLKGKGEFTGENLFIDGTKIEADANRYTFVWKKATEKYEKKLEEKIAGLLEELRQIPELEFDENASISKILAYIDKYVKEKGIVFVSGKGHRKTAVQRIFEKLTECAERKAKYDLYNSIFDGRNSFSKTDHDATFMRMKDDHMKNGQLKPGYNLQIAVEGEYIVGTDISSFRSDMLTLIPFLKKLDGENILKLLNIVTDSGYESEENYKYLAEHELNAYIKPSNYEQSKKRKYKLRYGLPENMQYDASADEYTCKNGKKLRKIGTTKVKSASGFLSEKTIYECESCAECAYKENCTKAKGNKQLRISRRFSAFREQSLENILTEFGKQLRMNRSIQAEGAFGVLKQDWSFRRFLMRGKNNVMTEWTLLCTAFDIRKYASKISRKLSAISLFQLKPS